MFFYKECTALETDKNGTLLKEKINEFHIEQNTNNSKEHESIKDEGNEYDDFKIENLDIVSSNELINNFDFYKTVQFKLVALLISVFFSSIVLSTILFKSFRRRKDDKFSNTEKTKDSNNFLSDSIKSYLNSVNKKRYFKFENYYSCAYSFKRNEHENKNILCIQQKNNAVNI
jgi:hypothetical protein